MAGGGRQAARARTFVFRCVRTPLWELNTSGGAGSGHNPWIFLSPSLVSIKKIFISFAYQPNYFTLFLHKKLEDLIHICLVCKTSQKGSKLYSYFKVPGGKRQSVSSLCPKSLGIPATTSLPENELASSTRSNSSRENHTQLKDTF